MEKSGIAASVISHPQGGGAIAGLGDSFAPDLHTGTGNLSVPIALPPGRGGFQPRLSLIYSTGQGNGPFGLGWALDIPGVTRDTRDGVPVYDDDKDVFLLSGAERLVATKPGPGGAMLCRPRTEGLFARIQHHLSDRDDYWEVRSRSGQRSLYGTPGARGADPAAVRDPDDPAHVFAWNLTLTTDPFGNRIEYLYERDAVAEAGPHRWDQLRLKTVRYGDWGPRDAPSFLVTVDLVYGPRPDPFSSYRAGFEIRSVQRCRQIEIRTHADATRLASLVRFTYQDELPEAAVAGPGNGVSLLRRIETVGVDGDEQQALPPLDLGYSGFDPGRRVYRALGGRGGSVPERSLADPDLELADLFGRGLPDLVEIGDVSRYWRNLGEGRFDLPRPLDRIPPGLRLGDPGTQLADLDGDGQIDLLLSQPGLEGYLPLTAGGPTPMRPFIAYERAPPFALDDPELRLLDLDGDGVTDALRTGESFEFYYHDRDRGWTDLQRVARDDLDRFPDIRFSDARVKLADMTGDGLTDIVFIDGARVDYWPSLGRGRWGRRVTMSGRLDFPDASYYGGRGFDPTRLLLGDVDGDGAADLVYVESGRVTVWLNRSGNGWSEPIVIRGTPPVAETDAVRLADMLGHGTDGILWSYDARDFADSSYKFLDLAGETKPYLLTSRDNNAGARMRIRYASSTRFYQEDERDPATRWRSRLPFPLQVVARIEAIDVISGGRLVSEFRYHQGYWDGEEREFRGFGMVEQLDSESFAAPGAEAAGEARFSPPILTRSWFHQGQIQAGDGSWHESEAGPAVWPGDPGMLPGDQRIELDGIAKAAAQTADSRRLRHALRALRGSVLRTELYARDGTALSDRPYTVTEALYDVREIEPDDPGAADRLRIFAPLRIASRTTQWERGTEPLTQFSFAGGFDAYGQPRTQLSVAVPRGRDPLRSGPPGEPWLATYAVTRYAQRDDEDHYLVDRVAASFSHEVLNDGSAGIWALRDAVAAGTAALRLIGHSRSFYDGEAFTGLPLGQIGEHGLLMRSEALAFTDGFLDGLFAPGDPHSVMGRPCYLATGAVTWTEEYPAEFRTGLPPLLGYVHYDDADVPGSPGGYYITAERHRYDVQDPAAVPRGLRRASLDPAGAESQIDYDEYGLLPVRVTDAVGLTVEAAYDYRLCKTRRIAEPNGNLTLFDYSPAGLLTGRSARGKNGEGDANEPSLELSYDLLAFAERGQPISVTTRRRVHHDSETGIPAAERDLTLAQVEYSDGFGRLIQRRLQAEDLLFGDPVTGSARLPLDQGAPVPAEIGRRRGAGDPPNVIVSGWQVFDNKGRVVEKYEAFFGKGWDYQAPLEAQLGQKALLFRDPRGQVLRILYPDGSERRTIFGIPQDLADPSAVTPTPWEAYSYDANDNAGRTHGAAAGAYGDHWNTPSSLVVDGLARSVVTVARNGADPADWLTTRAEYDIQGNLLSLTDPLGRTRFRHVFDLLGRRWRADTLDAGRQDTVFDARGNAVELRDSKGALSLQTSDILNRPVRFWARDDATAPVTLRQRLAYGDGGTAAQPAAERQAARDKNLLGLLTRHHDEAGLATVLAVDFKGNVLEAARRVIADAPILAAFDQAAAQGWRIAPFRTDWQPAPGQTLAARESQLLEPTEYRTSTQYDALSRPIAMRFPEDVEGQRRLLRATYNNGGALETASLDGRLCVGRIAYDARGRRSLIAYGNGVMARYAYDPQSFRLARLRSERFTQPDAETYRSAGEPLQDLAYGYDLVGNILRLEERVPGCGVLDNPDAGGASDPALAQLLASGDALVRRFRYDPIYRLLAATGRECDRPPTGPPWTDQPRGSDLTKARAYAETYRYDGAGNLLELEHRSGSDGFTRQFDLAAGGNRLRSTVIGPDRYDAVFDEAGNMTAETSSRHFDWDHGDRLKAFRIQTEGAEPSLFAQYLYDAAGRRVKKLVRKQGGQVEVTHDVTPLFEHARWGSGAAAAANNRLQAMDDSQRIASLRIGPARPGDPSPAVRFTLSDHLGSANLVIDETGAWTNREEFTPYGETCFGGFAMKRYRFTGKERDEESGLGYHGARYYAPWLGRWISSDPLGPAGGGNLFAYAAGNPLRFFDSTGLQAETMLVRDEDGQVMESLIIMVNDTAPPEGPLDSARRRGIADPMSRDEMERQEIFEYEHTPGHMSVADRIAYYRDHPWAYDEYYEGLQKRHNDYWRGQEADLLENYRRIDVANGAVHEILAFELFGVTTAVGVGTVGVGGFLKGTGFSFLLAGSTSEGGFHGCGAVAGMGGGAFVRSPAPVMQDFDGVAAYVPGAKSAITNEADDLALWARARQSGSESLRYKQNGVWQEEAGTATNVKAPTGQGVTETIHPHPQSEVALPSKGDIMNNMGQFAANTQHSVLGNAFPHADSFLVSEGLEPFNLVMKTTYTQGSAESLLVKFYRITFGSLE